MRVSPDSVWRHGDFLLLWSATTISLFGSQVGQFALSLIAVLVLGASSFEMGLLQAASTAPLLLFALLAGVQADRVRRRPVLIWADVVRGLAIGAIPLVAALGMLRIEHLLVAAFVVGACTVFFDVAYQAYVPSLIERRRLVAGNSGLEVSRSAAEITGPGVAGVLVQIVSAPIAVAVDALSYLASALLLARIRSPEAAPAPPGEAPRSARDAVREGLEVIRTSRLLRPIAACTAVWNLFSAIVRALLLLSATRDLGMSPAAFGLAIGVGGLGALLAALATPRLSLWIGPGPVIVAGATVGSLAYLWIPLVALVPGLRDPWVAAGALAVAQAIGSFAGTAYNIAQVSLRQAIVPEHLQGRVNATMRFLVWGTMPLGALVGGTLGDALGPGAVLVGAALGCQVVPLFVLLSPVRTLREMPSVRDA
jgi:MFS family permease